MALKRYEVNGVLVNLSDKDAKARGLDPKSGIPRRPFPKVEAPAEEPVIVSSKRAPRDTTPKTTAGDPVVNTDSEGSGNADERNGDVDDETSSDETTTPQDGAVDGQTSGPSDEAGDVDDEAEETEGEAEDVKEDETPEPETKTEDETPSDAPAAENKKANAPNKARRTRSRG